jgi:hypothetical protein
MQNKQVMTPKEKAKELFSTYRYALSIPNAPLGENKDSVAKQCALIAVDEIITTLNYDIRDLDVRGNVLLDLISYWQEVKQEIENMY